MCAITLSWEDPSFVIASFMRTPKPMMMNIVKRLEVRRQNFFTISQRFVIFS